MDRNRIVEEVQGLSQVREDTQKRWRKNEHRYNSLPDRRITCKWRSFVIGQFTLVQNITGS
jgi:hypothetical protein